jgi:hypothetical protein
MRVLIKTLLVMAVASHLSKESDTNAASVKILTTAKNVKKPKSIHTLS